ncbi:MAG: ABC transporter permease [Polyangiales bacterium]
MLSFVDHVGQVTVLALRAAKVLFTTRFDMAAFVYQIEQLGVRSFAIAAATAIFVAIVMTIQFAVTMEVYGAKDTLGRVIVIAEARELAPSLTALVVGSRIAAGMAAEIGSMVVTEQIDAIRALGADPIRKLVVPRLSAGVVIAAHHLHRLCARHDQRDGRRRGFYDVTTEYFISTALDSLTMKDIGNGIFKTPFFDFNW